MATNINDNETIKELQKKNAELEAKLKEERINRSWDWENAHANDWKNIKQMGEI